MTLSIEEINKRFRSAVVLPYAFQDGEMRLLVGKERKDSQDDKKTWSAFGAVKNDDDKEEKDCIDTAIRGFMHQTIGMFSPASFDALTSTVQTDMNAVCEQGYKHFRAQVDKLLAESGGLEAFARYIESREELVLCLEVPFVEESHFDSMVVMNDHQDDPARQVKGDDQNVQIKDDVIWAPATEVFHLVQRVSIKDDEVVEGDKPPALELYEWFEDEENNDEMQYLHPSFAQQITHCESLLRDFQNSHVITAAE